MSKNQILSTSYAVSIAIFLNASGCASGPKLETYPRREIERPYTLPDGVNNWQTSFGIESTSSSQNPSDTEATGNMMWEQSLSDDWTLIWDPLPLGMLHQFTKTETDRIGASIELGAFEDSSINGFALFPKVSFSERHSFNSIFAVDVTPFYAPRIAFQDGQGFHWVTGVKIAPLFQVTDTLALQPAISLDVSRGIFQEVTNNDFNSTDILPPESTRFTMPISATVRWSVSRRWDLEFQYTYYGIGYEDGFTDHFGSINAIYYW